MQPPSKLYLCIIASRDYRIEWDLIEEKTIRSALVRAPRALNFRLSFRVGAERSRHRVSVTAVIARAQNFIESSLELCYSQIVFARAPKNLRFLIVTILCATLPCTAQRAARKQQCRGVLDKDIDAKLAPEICSTIIKH